MIGRSEARTRGAAGQILPSMAETSPLILFGLQTDGSNNLKKEGNLV
jgi:hypothetical protein